VKISLGALSVRPRIGNEPFHQSGQNLGFDIAGFWRWAASNLASNVWRGVLAEYLVARALGLDVDAVVRTEWDACDIRTPNGLRIEVKSAAYVQTWHQRDPSTVRFTIAMKRGWDASTNTTAPAPCRDSDVYVFALLAHADKAALDPLNVAQWEVFVASARALDTTFGTQKSIGLSSLHRLAPEPVAFSALRGAVATAAGVREADVS